MQDYSVNCVEMKTLPVNSTELNEASRTVCECRNLPRRHDAANENANEIASSIHLSGTQGSVAKAIGQEGRGRG